MTAVLLQARVAGIGLLGPGLADWPQGAALLREPAAWQRLATVVHAPARLPATERRRAGVLVKASVVVADAACAHAGLDPATLASVFASATGDPANCHALCEALALPERAVSPTRFTNSVHNAAAGYWHIATGSTHASTSLAAHDASAAVALLEALVQCASTGLPVLLVVGDQPMPAPMNALRPVEETFAFALVLVPPSQGAGPLLSARLVPQCAATVMATAGFEALRSAVPAARALPLLHALAAALPSNIALDLQDGMSLHVQLDAARTA